MRHKAQACSAPGRCESNVNASNSERTGTERLDRPLLGRCISGAVCKDVLCALYVACAHADPSCVASESPLARFHGSAA